MEPTLYEAASTGNVGLLNEAIGRRSGAELQQYLLAQTADTKDNILHIAAQNGHEIFIRQVVECAHQLLLPQQILTLLCQQNDENQNNPLHIAAAKGHLQIVKILVESYHKYSKLVTQLANTSVETRVVVVEDSGVIKDGVAAAPPWLATAGWGETPLNMAIVNKNEEVAAYILEQDMEKLCNIHDFSGKTALYLAVEEGVERIALLILESDCSYSLGQRLFNQTFLHDASQITERLALVLLQKHPELFKTRGSRGETFLHNWAFSGKLESLKCLLKSNIFSKWNSSYKELLCLRNNFGDNPLHCAVNSNKVEVLKLLIDTYLQLLEPNGGQLHDLPWLNQNNRGETPLHLAIERNIKEDIVLYLLSFDSRLASIPTFYGKSPLFLAVECGKANIAHHMLSHGSRSLLHCGPKGQNPLHVASKCPGIAGWICEMLGIDLMDMKDEDGKAPLHYAAQAGDTELMDMAFRHSGISSAPTAWIEACEGGHLEAFNMFMNEADFRQLYVEQRDTPLHHFKLKSKEEYQKVLEIPMLGQLKNAIDSEGATPLHRAIDREDIVFVELLLGTHGIDWTIKDKNGRTAMDLLAKLCDQFPDWDAMCKRIGMNPRIRTTYIPLKTNLAEIRSTLSVVAALLATITFAAGFTIPGGFNDDGYVILARKAAFIVFLLSDTYAMCCSMLVLFCIIWAMVCDPDKSLVLIDGSVFLLQQSLYGTLVAFMTGVYTVVSHDCLWTAIVVCVMCSLVAIAANKSVLYKLLNKFIPTAR